MHLRRALTALVAGLITGGMIAAVATPAHARPRAPRATLTAHAATGAVTVGDPTSVGMRLRPAATTRLQLQELVSGHWVARAAAVTASDGTAVVRLDSPAAGLRTFRAVTLRSTGRATSPSFTVNVVASGAGCKPAVDLVDHDATPAARCLAARLDRWQKAGMMGVGQQLNVSNADYLAPLTLLGDRQVSVVGFDLQELADGQTYQFATPPLDALVALAQQGAVLSATWHATNPFTTGKAWDRSQHDLGLLLLDPDNPDNTASYAFWHDFDAKMELLSALQDQGVAVAFRPFHEANGNWFWWGRPDPATFRALWSMMQKRAAADGVHNVLWTYSFNADTSGRTVAPVSLLPPVRTVDIAGIDSYGSPATKQQPATLPMTGYAAVAAKVKRMTITEAGPYQAPAGNWNPAVITKTARAQSPRPLWSMLWFDDLPDASPRYLRQISSLSGWRAWMDSCPSGYCTLF